MNFKLSSYLLTITSFFLFSSCSHTEKKINPSLSRIWVKSTTPTDFKGTYININFEPIVYSNRVITANNIDGVTAFHKKYGTKAWTLKVKGGVSSPGLLVSDYLFFSGYDGKAYALSAKDGKLLWKTDIEYPSTQKFYYENGKIYVENQNSQVFCFEASSGEKVWDFSKKGSTKISVSSIDSFLSLGSLLITGFKNGSLVALEKSTGKMRWQRSLNFNTRFKDLNAFVLFDTDKILVAGYDDFLYSINGSDGALKWRRKIPVITNLVNMEKKQICFGTSDNLIQCIDPAVGNITTQFKISSKAGLIEKKNETTIFFGRSNGGLEVLNISDGKNLIYPTFSGISSKPMWSSEESKVYFNSNFGNLYVLKYSE